jgi:hypothetical protein
MDFGDGLMTHGGLVCGMWPQALRNWRDLQCGFDAVHRNKPGKEKGPVIAHRAFRISDVERLT